MALTSVPSLSVAVCSFPPDPASQEPFLELGSTPVLSRPGSTRGQALTPPGSLLLSDTAVDSASLWLCRGGHPPPQSHSQGMGTMLPQGHFPFTKWSLNVYSTPSSFMGPGYSIHKVSAPTPNPEAHTLVDRQMYTQYKRCCQKCSEKKTVGGGYREGVRDAWPLVKNKHDFINWLI